MSRGLGDVYKRQPVHHFAEIAESGGDSVTFHVEATDDAAGVIARARELGLGAGIAFKPETTVEAAARAAEGVDLALCMSIEPGYSGQAFMPNAVERIRRLRELVSCHVQVDGGIDDETAPRAREAGANLLVAGTAVFRDVPAAYARLVELTA